MHFNRSQINKGLLKCLSLIIKMCPQWQIYSFTKPTSTFFTHKLYTDLFSSHDTTHSVGLLVPVEWCRSCCSEASQIFKTWAICWPTYTQQLCELKRFHKKTLLVLQRTAKRFLWVWISVLGLVPRVPASVQDWEEKFSLLRNTSRGVCAQVIRSVRAVCLSSHTLKWRATEKTTA